MQILSVVTKLKEAKEAYYNDCPIMSDAEFDALEETLRKLDPTNTYFDIVGIAEKGEKMKHVYPMISMAKAQSVEDVKTWLNKISDKRLQLIIEPKIDGLSASCVYENGKLQYILTRGDGVEGRVITHIKDYVNIPHSIEETDRIEVRGELYIPQNGDFPNPENKPLRNLAVGLVNRKDTGLEDLKYIKFVAYQLLGTDIDKESEKIEEIKNYGFEVVHYTTFSSIKELENYFNMYKNDFRRRWSYETDGLIISINDCNLFEEINSKYTISHHNFYNIALKPESESMWTTVKGITWNVSKSGSVVPVVNIEPVVIGGATIKNVTANNYENVDKLKINIGDKIHISRANDVIPFLVESIPQYNKSHLIPTHCPSCDNVLEKRKVHIVCNNGYCPEKNIQLITSWVRDCDMDGVSEATVRLLYDNSLIRTIKDLYDLSILDVEALAGFGDKKTDNLMEQIEKSKSMTIVQFLARLSIELLREKAVKKLGISSIEDFWKFNDSQYVTGQNLIAYRQENEMQMRELLAVLNVSDIASVVDSKGKVCMTGSGPKGRKELVKDIEAKGYTYTDSINKETSILLSDDITGTSSKLVKARKLGIELKTYTEFFN